MRTLFCSLFFVLCSVFVNPARGEENYPIISANGFSCSQAEGMVSCRGSFPSQPNPVIEATGYNVVWIRGDYPGSRYTYYSDSGCLCAAEFESNGKVRTQECTSRLGNQKSFKGGKSTYDWCKKN
ncbi:MAG: hypothetical protein K8R69_02585 [Deltaproteobacteria bacterium]|nr:hypothetical protein [Deltaproteobacteria bacterium]